MEYNKNKKCKCVYVKYENGDSVKFTGNKGWQLDEALLHRGDVEFKISASKGIPPLLIYPNGMKFEGIPQKGSDFEGIPTESSVDCIQRLLSYETIDPYSGTLYYPDRRTMRYEWGKSDEQRKKEIEAEKKRNEEKNKAAYQDLCKQFGQKYVDAALARNPIIGMPEQLFMGAFNNRLEYAGTSGNTQIYYILGWGATNYGSTATISNNRRVGKLYICKGRIIHSYMWNAYF